MARDIVIFGAGGLARELSEWMQRDDAIRVRALVSDRDSDLDDQGLVPVLTRDATEALLGAPSFVLGLSDPSAKRRIAGELRARGWIPMSWVDPSAIVATTARVGTGVVICPFCTVSPNATLSEFVLLNVGCGIGHDAQIGAFSSLLGRASINGNVSIGDEVLVGAGASVVPGRSIGARSVIGIGSVVIGNVPDDVSVFGNPARRVQS